MSDIDFEHISHLFDIVKGCAEHTGKFGSIQTEAFNELNSVNAQLRKKQMDKKAADEKAEAGKKAKDESADDGPRAIPSSTKYDLSGKPIADEPSPVERRL